MRSVQNSVELRRILAAPRRIWTDEEASGVARRLTRILRTPCGKMVLWPDQAVALAELGVHGLMGVLRVGSGKTLISLLAATVLNVTKHVLIVPAAMVPDTRQAIEDLSPHWRIRPPEVVSYEFLGVAKNANWLNDLDPELIICDEAHRIKNPRAAVTRRVMRFLWEHPSCKFGAMTGSITNRSIKEFAHLAWRTLGENCPVPRTFNEIEEWACALDSDVPDEARLDPGCLLALCNGVEREEAKGDRLTAARKAFRRRLVETPGVVTAQETPVDIPILVRRVKIPVPKEVSDALSLLRKKWALPDGTLLYDGKDVWRFARQIALGFWYRWDPPPPLAWLAARKEWGSECRYILLHNQRKLDSAFEVAQAVQRGLYPRAESALRTWQAIEPSFTPNNVPVWLSDFAVEFAQDWAKEVGIVWTEHRAFGFALKAKGLAYFNGEETEPIGGYAGQSVVASIESHGTGKNLQAWNRNLVTCPMKHAGKTEQLLGRTHRPGQMAKDVTMDMMTHTAELELALNECVDGSSYIHQMTGETPKLLLARHC